ncbi:hypothetical protein [Succiniclasticum ruminis]|uniref:Uncharacterized protein n=1 Tax=Succiniclasticum ruminis DSM 9236 TaxID=1123323 RepID=A0A1I2DRH6_9FIRM|nr:hypothetical protein [Succiniclasticum ruminis]SFE83222.1 hypothetical protein SAMN05216245_1235 [Succiniclasticum ruminis DSM 9236]
MNIISNSKISEDVTGKNVATKTAVMENGEIKISVLNDDVYRLVDDARKNGKDLSYCFNDIVQLFNFALQDIELPYFSYDEKVIIADCLCGPDVLLNNILHLDVSVCDYIYDLGLTPTASHKDLIAKIKGLDFLQRVKLIYMIRSDFSRF